jgi:adenosylcobinamide-GDP ribazoletransferase
MWQGFLSAIQFLTIIPWGPPQAFDARKSLPFFPVCGLLIGGVLAVTDTIVLHFWSPLTAGILTLTVLAAISGALHLDGLADTADGLYSRRTSEKALAIMKDSRVGAMGMVTVVFCLGLKWAALTGMDTHRLVYLLIIPAYARSAVLFGTRQLPYGRPDGGTGHDFFQAPLNNKDFRALALVVMLSFLLGWEALIINIAFVLTFTVLIRFYRYKIGCITGDMLGAMIEITETTLFLVASARWHG